MSYNNTNYRIRYGDTVVKRYTSIYTTCTLCTFYLYIIHCTLDSVRASSVYASITLNNCITITNKLISIIMTRLFV